MSSSDLPKLWTTSSKFAKSVLLKSFFGIKNQSNFSEFFFCEEYLTRRSTFINEMFWNFWFLKYFVSFKWYSPQICKEPLIMFSGKNKTLVFMNIFVFYLESSTSTFFFHWNPYLKTDSANLRILFSVNDFHKQICRNFYIIFLRNISRNNVCIAHGKHKMQKIKNHNIATEK